MSSNAGAMIAADYLRRGLIVSCQAPEGSVLNAPATMALMAIAATQGGARAIRANGPADIAAIKASVSIPVVGLLKRHVKGYHVYITPSYDDADAVAAAGADLIAIDATSRARPGGATVAELIGHIRDRLNLPVVADVDSIAPALVAADAGASFVATTLSGYTGGDQGPIAADPDLTLVRELVGRVACPVIAEGRYRLPEHLTEAFRAGAYAVVVGEAITNPQATTSRFVTAIPR